MKYRYYFKSKKQKYPDKPFAPERVTSYCGHTMILPATMDRVYGYAEYGYPLKEEDIDKYELVPAETNWYPAR